ncbi:MAG: hypothetical protein O3A47_13265, partial [Chloroflexi bacterium]|nr:hypothetical protein [Chloroflexota bacterium]
YEILLNRIRTTTTRTGLTVDATLDLTDYPTRVKVSNDEFDQIHSIPMRPDRSGTTRSIAESRSERATETQGTTTA